VHTINLTNAELIEKKVLAMRRKWPRPRRDVVTFRDHQIKWTHCSSKRQGLED